MNWFTLLKQPKLRVGSKITTNLGIESKNEDNDCERKVEEIAIKVGNYSKPGSKLDGYSSLDFMPVKFPEEVYCKVLEMLNKIQPNDGQTEFIEVNNIEYNIDVAYLYYQLRKEASMWVKIHDLDLEISEYETPFYIVLDFDNREAGLSEEEALKKVDFR